MNDNLTINFDNVEAAEASKLALELKGYLLQTLNIESQIIKENDSTQDFGATLGIILGSASVVALANGISNWMLKQQSRKLTVKKDGEIIGENLSSQDIKKILEIVKDR